MSENIILDYALKNYKKMFREADQNLTHPFLVPGSVYCNAIWDWDCWLTNVALAQFVPDDFKDYEIGCVLNFIDSMLDDGRMPISMLPSYTKEVVISRGEANIHKPCLAQHAAFIIKRYDDAEWIRSYFSKLCCFVDYYINNCRHQNGIYFWINDSAIGVDNDPSTFFRPNKSSGSIYLNCFMYKELKALCFIADKLGYDAKKYDTEAENLKQAIRTHCYDEKDGTYYSVDLNLNPIVPNRHTGAPRHWDSVIERMGCWSSFLALWSGIATPEQAERMVKENLLDPKAFWAPFGVRTLSKYEKMYVIKKSGDPSCWLGPIWGVSNYMVFRGLVKYGFLDQARELGEKTVALFENDIKNTGELHEYYDPESGEPVMNPGFQNWNLLAINIKAWLDGQPVVEEF